MKSGGKRPRHRTPLARIAAGTLTAVLTSDVEQKIALVLPPGMAVDRLTADGKPQAVVEQGVRKLGCNLDLPKGKSVTVEASFQPLAK